MDQFVFYVMSLKTRMHSSEMRKPRLLTISQHALRKREVSTQGVSAQGDVCLWSRVVVCRHAMGQTHSVDRQTPLKT